MVQFSKFKDFLWVCWFLGKNLSNFVYPVWKLHNPYCHNHHLTLECKKRAGKRLKKNKELRIMKFLNVILFCLRSMNYILDFLLRLLYWKNSFTCVKGNSSSDSLQMTKLKEPNFDSYKNESVVESLKNILYFQPLLICVFLLYKRSFYFKNERWILKLYVQTSFKKSFRNIWQIA